MGGAGGRGDRVQQARIDRVGGDDREPLVGQRQVGLLTVDHHQHRVGLGDGLGQVLQQVLVHERRLHHAGEVAVLVHQRVEPGHVERVGQHHRQALRRPLRGQPAQRLEGLQRPQVLRVGVVADVEVGQPLAGQRAGQHHRAVPLVQAERLDQVQVQAQHVDDGDEVDGGAARLLLLLLLRTGDGEGGGEQGGDEGDAAQGARHGVSSSPADEAPCFVQPIPRRSSGGADESRPWDSPVLGVPPASASGQQPASRVPFGVPSNPTHAADRSGALRTRLSVGGAVVAGAAWIHLST